MAKKIGIFTSILLGVAGGAAAAGRLLAGPEPRSPGGARGPAAADKRAARLGAGPGVLRLRQGSSPPQAMQGLQARAVLQVGVQ